MTTAAGTRYLSGRGEEFLQALRVLTLLCVGTRCSLLVLADGARWIRTFYAVTLAVVPARTMLIDWWHVRAKCNDLASRFCRGWLAKERVVRRLQRHLWRGEVDAACTCLESYRSQARNVAKLDELCAYLHSRQEFLPDYRTLYTHCHYIGSGHVEKTNDLVVARRQKGGGRHWSQETSTALATLRTLQLNGGWHAYWHEHHMPSLLAA